MQNCTSSATMRRSQASASWKPAPIAWPCTAATVSRVGSRSHENPAWKAAIVVSASSSGIWARLAMPGCPSTSVAVKNLRSSPAENARPAPRTTTARTSAGNDSPIARSASHVDGVCAFNTSGRASVIVARGPSTSSVSPPRVRSSGSIAAVVMAAGYPGAEGGFVPTSSWYGWRRRVRAA
jgi:hypothetical protein